VRRCILEKDT